MGFGYIAYSRVNPALPKHLLVPVASLGCANTAVFMKMHLGFARTDFSRRHSTQEPSLAAIAGSGPQDAPSSQPTRAGCPWRPRFVVLWRAEMLSWGEISRRNRSTSSR